MAGVSFHSTTNFFNELYKLTMKDNIMFLPSLHPFPMGVIRKPKKMLMNVLNL